MSSEATNIDDLPNSNNNNSVINMNQEPVQQVSQISNSQLSQEDINRIVSGIQNAGQNNMTSLPSKDIPMEQNTIHSDPSVKPNFVPDKEEKYIHESNIDDLTRQFKEKKIIEERNNDIFEILTYPILLSVLFLFFQLPFINKNIFKYLPSFFFTDGNLNFNGYLLKSVLFGSSILVLQKTIDYLLEL